MNFEEGKEYSFVISDIIHLPDNDYFVIEYSDGRKFMMRKSFYNDNYSLATGKKIICRVDKINCTGKIFFEPIHPYYSNGDKDVFEITGESTRRFKKTEGTYKVLTAINNKNDRAIVKETDVLNLNEFAIGERIEASIKKISRGELQLEEVKKLPG